MAEITQENIIWQVLDNLRQEMEPRRLGIALATLIYLRWADFQDAEQEAIAAFDGSEYEPALPSSMHWRSWHAFQPEELKNIFIKSLPNALERLGNVRHKPLATQLNRVAFALKYLSGLSHFSLSALVQWIAQQPFETPRNRRKLLHIFDEILDKVTDRHSGDFRTPPEVARLLVEIAAPAAGASVYDPCFGSAELLTAACDYVLRNEKNLSVRSGVPSLQIFGVERNIEMYVIGLTRLALAGVDEPQLEWGSSLERVSSGSPQQNGFDIVLANPPWGMRVDSPAIEHYPIRTKDSAGLFVQHALSQLRPDGCAVMIVPQGFLFRGGPERQVRKMIMEQHSLEAVVAMPSKSFMPYTAAPSSILVFRRGGSTRSVRMIDGGRYFEKSTGRHSVLLNTNLIEAVRRALHDPKPPDHCRDINFEEIAENDWNLTPSRWNESELQNFLPSLPQTIPVMPLKGCCQIIAGRSVHKNDLMDTAIGENHIPYVRISDVQHGQVNKGSSWLSPQATAQIDAKWKLRAGDILLSKSGTIGKSGMVCNGAVGAIASGGFYVLQSYQEILDPHFLLSYLNCSDCQRWLSTRATGSVINNLTRSVISELPIPLPPLQMQQLVATEYAKHGVDALIFLNKLFSQAIDPITEAINKAQMILSIDKLEIDDPLDLSDLERLSTGFQSVRNNFAHSVPDDLSFSENSLVEWVFKFNQAISGLRDIRNVPKGPSLLSLMQDSIYGLRSAINAIRDKTIHGHVSNGVMARKLTESALNKLELACSALLRDVRLNLTTNIDALRAGEMTEFVLHIENKGPLPLRGISIITEPDWGSGKIGYLAENTSTNINLQGNITKAAGIFTLIAKWSGTTLDGNEVSDIRELPFSVYDRDVTSVKHHDNFGASPYVCGDPIRPERGNVFFGREELLERIRRQVMQNGNVILLEGNRRAGKSSILWHLEGKESIPGWMGVYCSLQSAEGSQDKRGVPTEEVFRVIAASIARSLHSLGEKTPLPDGTILAPGKKLGIAKACRIGIGVDSSFSDFRDYVEVALNKLDEFGLGLLLMLDEFDKLQEGIDSGVTSPQVPENIRFLIHEYPRFSAILTGSRRLSRLREEYWSALYGLGTHFRVTSLPSEAARRLVTEPVKGSLSYSQEAVERAVYLTAGQPFLLQCLCNRIFDIAAQLKSHSVTLDLIDQAVSALMEDNEHFASLWDYIRSYRRQFILFLCHRMMNGPDPFRIPVIMESLTNFGIQVSEDILATDLESLRELELLDFIENIGGGHYRLAIPLMGIWMERQRDFTAVRIKAIAETGDHVE